MKKQREEKNFERLAIDAEQACKVQIEKIRGLDYVNTRVATVKEQFSISEKDIDRFIKDSEEVENQIDEIKKGYETVKKQFSDKISLDKDSFLFPEGTPSKIYNIQLVALQVADTCEGCHNELVRLANGYDENLSDRKQKNRKLTECSVVIDIDDKINKSLEDIKNALRSVIPADSLQSYAESLKGPKGVNLNYETAKKHCAALNSAGIKAIIRNKICFEAIVDDYERTTKEYTKPLNEIKEICNDSAPPKPYGKPEKMFWGFTLGICAIFFLPALLYATASGKSDFISIIVPSLIFSLLTFIPITIAYLIYYKRLSEYKKQTEKIDNLKEKINSFTEQIKIEINKQCDFYEIYDRIDSEVFSRLNEKCKLSEQTGERILEKMADIYHWVDAQNEKFLEYLPSNLDRQLLPRMVKLMERGAATDYKTALQLATQEEKAEREYEEQRNIIAREQAKRTAEIQAQRLMQEYYEKQRLEIAREQSESQKRAEQYAKQQAEAAERQREASEAAAKAAEKQAENTEELLRRSNDPYYINQWKNN